MSSKKQAKRMKSVRAYAIVAGEYPMVSALSGTKRGENQHPVRVLAESEYQQMRRIQKRAAETLLGLTCSQCGRYFDAKACGPTHASIFGVIDALTPTPSKKGRKAK